MKMKLCLSMHKCYCLWLDSPRQSLGDIPELGEICDINCDRPDYIIFKWFLHLSWTDSVVKNNAQGQSSCSMDLKGEKGIPSSLRKYNF